MNTDDQLKEILRLAGEIDGLFPRRIWIEGDNTVYCDGPGNIQRHKLNSLDLIRLIHIAKTRAEQIISIL